MLRSKHSGWTWEGKRTPFGGGGGIGNAFGLGDALASIDPGPSIGNGLASVDQAVNQIPGGWYTVGILAAGGTALAFAPELAAAAGLGEGATISSVAGQQAFFDALASGASSTEAISAGAAADAAIGGGIGAGTNAALQGPTYGELGITGVEGGMAGPTYAEMGYTGLNSNEAIAAADAASNSRLLSDALGNIKDAGKLSQLLKQGATSGLTGSLGKIAQGANPMGASQLQVVRGNQNPFTYSPQQPIQDTKQAQLASLLKQG